MKLFIFLLLSVCYTSIGQAQNEEKTPYLFKTFQDAIVYFKDGSQYHEKMNYNLLVEKFFFLDRTDKTIKLLGNPKDIQSIKFGERIFYIEKGKGIEVLATNPVLYVQYKGNIRKEPTKGAYGQPSETSSIKSYGGTYGSRGERYDFDPEKLVLGRQYNIYQLERKGKKKAFKNFKQFIRLYPNHEKEINRFIDVNHIDFNDVEQIKALYIYTESL